MTLKNGVYGDLRREKFLGEQFEVSRGRVEGYQSLQKEGLLRRVVGDDGFICTSHLDQGSRQETKFSRYLKKYFLEFS